MKRGFFARLRERLFGEKEARKEPAEKPASSASEPARPSPTRKETPPHRPTTPSASKPKPARKQSTGRAKKAAKPQKKERLPYWFQVGFDFGTAYCKCVIRDLNLNKAWLYVPKEPFDRKLPFLLPSRIHFANESYSALTDHRHYGSETSPYLKMAFADALRGFWTNDLLKEMGKLGACRNRTQLKQFVRDGSIYLLGGWFGQIRQSILKRFPDFGSDPKDVIAVNMALPVADAEEPLVHAGFEEVLKIAWSLSDKLAGHPSIGKDTLRELIAHSKAPKSNYLKKLCYVYPEVSANMQGFVRSRVSQPGIYLFSDAGAGTVDQSLFIFSKPDGDPFLHYLSARVSPIGSSQIERVAAERDGGVALENLERWRLRKEQGDNYGVLSAARMAIRDKLSKQSISTLARGKLKLPVRSQISKTDVIFGGGGHCANPYQFGVTGAFDSEIFNPPITPSWMGMPTPTDLDLGKGNHTWLNRLSVAYGLSFPRDELAEFDYPSDVPDAKPFRPHPKIPDPPTKDDC